MNLENNNKIPLHVGIIMDGNGRWAKERNLSRSMGHKKGADNLKDLVPYIFKKGVKYLSLYAFSVENFKRSNEEVEYLMNLFIDMFKKDFLSFDKEKVRVIFSGKREPLRTDVLEAMDEISERTKNNSEKVLNICLNYGSQDEIVDATKKIAQLVLNGKIKLEDINKELIGKSLYQDLPDLDLVIRTSGEFRISNFMLWQSAYTEYYFTNTYFPDFKEEGFDLALEKYNKRNRRFGGIKDEN